MFARGIQRYGLLTILDKIGTGFGDPDMFQHLEPPTPLGRRIGGLLHLIFLIQKQCTDIVV